MYWQSGGDRIQSVYYKRDIQIENPSQIIRREVFHCNSLYIKNRYYNTNLINAYIYLNFNKLILLNKFWDFFASDSGKFLFLVITDGIIQWIINEKSRFENHSWFLNSEGEYHNKNTICRPSIHFEIEKIGLFHYLWWQMAGWIIIHIHIHIFSKTLIMNNEWQLFVTKFVSQVYWCGLPVNYICW